MTHETRPNPAWLIATYLIALVALALVLRGHYALGAALGVVALQCSAVFALTINRAKAKKIKGRPDHD